MQVTELPYNQLIGLEKSKDPRYLLQLSSNVQYGNHLGTVHAAALYALAEASCAQLLITELGQLSNQFVPVLRSAEVKYSKPAVGSVFSTAIFVHTNKIEIESTLIQKKRILLTIQVQLFSQTGEKVMQGNFDWFISATQ